MLIRIRKMIFFYFFLQHCQSTLFIFLFNLICVIIFNILDSILKFSRKMYSLAWIRIQIGRPWIPIRIRQNYPVYGSTTLFFWSLDFSIPVSQLLTFPTMNNMSTETWNLFSLCAESQQALPLIFVESLLGEIGQKLLLSNRAVGRGEAIKQIWGQVYRQFTRLHPPFLLPPPHTAFLESKTHHQMFSISIPNLWMKSFRKN